MSGINQDEVNAWIALLRSGKYEQGAAVLRSGDDEFCCLGVYCDGRGGGRWELLNIKTSKSYKYVCEDGDATIFLPSGLARKIGCNWQARIRLDDALRALLDEKRISYIPINRAESVDYVTLIFLNDEGFSFEEIADVLERGLLLPDD